MSQEITPEMIEKYLGTEKGICYKSAEDFLYSDDEEDYQKLMVETSTNPT